MLLGFLDVLVLLLWLVVIVCWGCYCLLGLLLFVVVCCSCCFIVVLCCQVGDLPTGIIVVRHLAGPRTPQELQAAIGHFKNDGILQLELWNLPVLLSEGEPSTTVKIEDNEEGETKVKSDKPETRVTPSSRAAGVTRTDDQKQTPSSSQPKQTTTPKTTTSTKNVKDESEVTVRVPHVVKGGRGRGRGRGRWYGRRPSSSKKSRGLTPTVKSSLRREDTESPTKDFDDDDVDDDAMDDTAMGGEAATSDPTMSAIPANQSAIGTAGGIAESREMVWKRLYCSQMHTQDSSHWYAWKVSVEQGEVEKCKISLQHRFGTRTKQDGDGSQVPLSPVSLKAGSEFGTHEDKKISKQIKSERKRTKISEDTRESPVERGRAHPRRGPSGKFGTSKAKGSVVDTSDGGGWDKGSHNGVNVVKQDSTLTSSLVREFVIKVPCCTLCGYDPYFKGGGMVKKALSVRPIVLFH